MAFNMAEARVMITTQTSGQQELAQLQQRIRELQGEVANTSTGMQGLTKISGQQKFAMRDLSFQISDVATQFSMGASPMQIFAAQGSQVIGALQMMTGEAKGLLGFLGGPWGMIISAAVVALTPLIGKLFETGDAAKDAERNLRSAAQAAQEYVGKQNYLKLNAKQLELNDLREERMKLELLTAKSPFAADPNAGWFSENRELGGAARRIQAIKWQEAELGNVVKLAEEQNAALEDRMNNVGSGHAAATTATRAHTAAVREHTSAVKAQVDVYQKLQDRLTAMPLAIQSEKLPDLRKDAADALKNMPRNIIDVPDLNPAYNGKMKALEDYGRTAGLTAQNVSKAWTDALNNTEDALVNFATTGKLNFKSLANSIIADIARIAIQQAIMKPLTSWLRGLFGNGAAFSGGNVVANANGNAFSGGNVTAFAGGGVVARPTLFPMAGGKTGLMGEAGAEAIMPLRRLGNGRLGVEAAGGGVQNVVVNVDASGNQQVQGNQDKAAALGNAISAAVRAELIQQKRPGGLLAA